jgi:hypothetical protein
VLPKNPSLHGRGLINSTGGADLPTEACGIAPTESGCSYARPQ